MNRKLLTQIHLIAAGLMAPAILMFLVTGALYTWGSTGDWGEQEVRVALDEPLAAGEAPARAAALGALAAAGVTVPSGTPRYEVKDGDAFFRWGGARSEIELAETAEPLVATATIKVASLHRVLVQLHKAKGSTAFKVYASILAAVLMLLVVSGIVLGLQVKALRRVTIVSSLVGILAFAGFVAAG